MQKFPIIIESVKGSNLKYRYDMQEQVFKLRKALPLGMAFPYDFGFIQGTRGEDGDPLDAMVLSEFTGFTGARIKCRLVGALLALQTEGRKKIRNDRFFFIPEDSVAFAHIGSMKDFGATHNQQLRDFFVNYNKADNKIFKPLQMIPAIKASALIFLAP